MKNNIPTKAEAAQFPVYDFTAPKKVSRDEIKSLNLVTDELARYMGVCISGMAGEVCPVYNPEILETNTVDFVSKLPKYSIVGIFTFSVPSQKNSESKVMVHFPTDIFYLLMDILLGGSGKPYEADRALSDIETAICRYVMSKLQEVMKNAWGSILSADFTFDRIETSSKNVEVKAAKEEKVAMSFATTVKGFSNKIIIYYSSSFIEQLMSNQETKKVKEAVSPEQDAQRRNAIMTSLGDAEFEVKAVMSELTLNLQDIVSLGVGDIITLDTKITDDIQVRVENVPWFYGKLGNGNIKKAVKITRMLSKNQIKAAENKSENQDNAS